jgi:hypothetical protein
MGKKDIYLKRIRIVVIGLTLGISVLALQSLTTGQSFFQYFAFGLTIFALFIISFMVAQAIKCED